MNVLMEKDKAQNYKFIFGGYFLPYCSDNNLPINGWNVFPLALTISATKPIMCVLFIYYITD